MPPLFCTSGGGALLGLRRSKGGLAENRKETRARGKGRLSAGIKNSKGGLVGKSKVYIYIYMYVYIYMLTGA